MNMTSAVSSSIVSRWRGGTRRRVVAALVAILSVVLGGLTSARAQDPDPAQLLEDFVFYCLTANPQLASASADALLGSGMSDADLAELLDEKGKTQVERFDAAVVRAQRIADPELERASGDLSLRIEQGRMDLARDPSRIDAAIQMLVGNQRERLLGRRRLVSAGEYAVPALLREITEGKNERLKNQCISVLQEIGRQAVTPLSAGLLQLGDPQSQRIVADILGTIGYAHAAPVLRELADDPNASSPVRDAADRALRRFNNPDLFNLPVSNLYAAVGRQYFDESESLIAFPGEPSNNVWSYDAFVGLQRTPVPTEIYGEVMAMKMASAALKNDPLNSGALSLFVASNLKRENEIPAGMTDPIFGENQYTPEFYATVFGTQTCLDVLEMALDQVNTPLVRDAIKALSQTTGGANLFGKVRTRQPLLEALQYPDRRAQYEAALTLARALPRESFPGDFAVVPLLGTAIRTGGKSFALVIADDAEDQRVLSNMLESLDFAVAGAGSSVGTLQISIDEAVGIDLVVVNKATAEETIQAITDLRLIPKTAASPVLIQATALELPKLRPEYRGDRRVLVGKAGVAEAQFEAQVDSVMEQGAGGRMTEAESEIYAIEALAALKDIAVSGSKAYDVGDVEPSLLEAVEIRSGGTRRLVADVLALLATDRAQQKLFDVALAATGDEQIELLDRVAESVKRNGDRAEPRHLTALVNLITSSEGATAEAAARVHGSMNVSSGDAVQLIP